MEILQLKAQGKIEEASVNGALSLLYKRIDNGVTETLGWSKLQSLVANTAAPTTGTIAVTTNLSTARFTLSGSSTYSGSGTSFTQTNVPAGTYQITYGAVSGYTPPPAEAKTLAGGGTISFSGVYASVQPALQVSTNALAFSATQGGGNPASQSVAISNIGSGTLNWTAAVTSGSSWLSVSPTAGTNSGNLSITTKTAGLTAGSYSGSVQVVASGAATSPQSIGVALNVNQGPASVPVINSVVSAASFASGAITPGEIISVFGTDLTTNVVGVVAATGVPLPTNLANTAVSINGIAAPLFAVANVNGVEQINLQVPYELAGQTSASTAVVNNGISSAPKTVSVLPAHPGIFTTDDGTSGIAVHGATNQLVSTTSPAMPGEVIVLYATGLGAVSPMPKTGAPAPSSPLSTATNPVSVSIGGLNATVLFAGLTPGFAGLYQINVVVPPSIGAGSLPIIVTASGQASKTVTLAGGSSSCSAPSISSQPQSTTIQTGQSTTLSVSATGTSLTYQWYQGNPSDASHPVGTNSSTLYVTGVTTTTTFWVRVKSACSTVDSNQATVTLQPSSTMAGSLVFVKNGDAYIIGTEGTGQRQLTTGGGVLNARLSNGVVVFKRNSRLYRTDTSGTTPVTIPNADNALEFDLKPSGDMIVLTYDGTGNNRYNNQDLYTIGIDGNNRKLINTNASEHHVSPSWGRDGYVYLVKCDVGNPYTQKVYRMPEGGGDPVLLVNYFSQNPVEGGPTHKVVFSYNQPAPTPRLMNTDGSGQTDIPGTPPNVGYLGVTYDYDADVIYYLVNGEIWRINTDGTNKQRLTTGVDMAGLDYGKK